MTIIEAEHKIKHLKKLGKLSVTEYIKMMCELRARTTPETTKPNHLLVFDGKV